MIRYVRTRRAQLRAYLTLYFSVLDGSVAIVFVVVLPFKTMKGTTMSAKQAELASRTSMWPDDQIALFESEDGDMIAYLPSALFKIWSVLIVVDGKITHHRACMGDSTKAQATRHVLRLLNDNQDLTTRTLARDGDVLTYSLPETKEVRKFQLCQLSSSVAPLPQTYVSVRNRNGVIVGFEFNK